MPKTEYPSLYQVNTRVWLTDLSREVGRAVTLDDIPDEALDRLIDEAIEWVWLLSVWQTGPEGRRISRENPDWQAEFRETLPDLTEDDVAGSGFAIAAYTVHASLGGDAALARLRARLRSRGIRLMLDFVPNHSAIDCPWVQAHSDYYVHGNEAEMAAAPANYRKMDHPQGSLILAHGRDPYFPGWPDTLQLNYGNPKLQEAMVTELTNIAGKCDGVRCDMAMLVEPAVFERTWGIPSDPFWPKAIRQVREQVPGFVFMAEVYWDMEWELQQHGFDYTYDKRLYDRLREGHAGPVRDHFLAAPGYQNKMARFLENHDEPRAAAAFPPGMHQAAAVLTYCSPGLRFFHYGQLQGKTKRISPHLVRGPQEPVNAELETFYRELLALLYLPAFKSGHWQLLATTPAWADNPTHLNYIAFAWEGPAGERFLVAVNYAPQHSQCYIPLPFPELDGFQWRLNDRISGTAFVRDGHDLQHMGLYLDEHPWRHFVFSFQKQ
ncbi:MAG: alpha-amylase family glycosyl hydrolase [Saprospiraceae bacterium]|nr:alpha-amylase family glycosyl hydrolase [Saprospiraceae bacterium]